MGVVINMVVAFVLLTTVPGQEEKLAGALRKKDSVRECHVVYGEYDLHLTMEAKDLHALDTFINELRSLKGIEHTMTLIAVGED